MDSKGERGEELKCGADCFHQQFNGQMKEREAYVLAAQAEGGFYLFRRRLRVVSMLRGEAEESG